MSWPRSSRLLFAAALGAVAMLPAYPALAQWQIGVAAPLSGSDAVFGAQIRAGVEQAVADLNAAGGFLGQRASVVLGDDLGDPKRAGDVAQDFVRRHVPVVVGPFTSSAVLPASAIYAGAGVLEITPSATAPQATERGFPTLFRLAAREDQQGAVAARYLLARHETRVAVLHDRTAAGKALADAFRKALAAGGVRDVLYAGVDKGDKDFAPVIARLKASGGRVAFWGGTQTEAGLLARQIRDAGLPTVLMAGVGIASEEFATLAGPGAEGTLMVFPGDPKERPEAADLLRKLTARGIEPSAYAFNAYAAVQVVHQAAQAAGSLDPQALARAMHDGRVFRTVLGGVAFDAKGDLAAPDYSVLTWRKGPTGRLGF